MGQPSRAAIIYNPVRVRIERLRTAVAAAERRHGWGPSTWYATQADDSGVTAAREALADGPQVVFVAAGDGTVRAVAEVLHGSETPVALLPVGTGNLLARNLRLPLADLERSVEVAFTGRERRIDIAFAELEDDAGRRSRSIFLVMAGIGFDSAMAEGTTSASKKRLGWLAYVRPIARSVIANQQFRLKYRIDGASVRTVRAHTVIVGNCGTLTGNMLLLPNAKLDDGLLDVALFRPKGGFGWTRVGARLTLHGFFRRTRLNRRLRQITPDLHALAYSQGRQFEVRFDEPHGVELDGDSVPGIVSARIRIAASALPVRVPA